MQSNEEKTDFKRATKNKGVWIPDSILTNPDLNSSHKILLSFIFSLDNNGCTAGNNFLADSLVWPYKTLQRNLDELKKLGYVRSINTKSGRKLIASTSAQYLEDETIYPVNETNYPVNETIYPVNEVQKDKKHYPVNEVKYPVNETIYPVNETIYPVNEVQKDKKHYPVNEVKYP